MSEEIIESDLEGRRVVWVLYFADEGEYVEDEPWHDSREDAEKYRDEIDWTPYTDEGYGIPVVVARFGKFEDVEYR